MLYLLHGAGNDYTSWTRETDVEALTADLPLLVVMPEAGWDGWYADWWNGGAGGPPMWETFHTGELRELLERDWQAGDERAVAGLSMGGLGAMSYAARHPGLFRAAASFSGMLHPVTLDPSIVGFDVPPDLWGDRTEQADVWAAHDPVELAAALEGTALYVSYGNGEPGPLDGRRGRLRRARGVVGSDERGLRGAAGGARHPGHGRDRAGHPHHALRRARTAQGSAHAAGGPGSLKDRSTITGDRPARWRSTVEAHPAKGGPPRSSVRVAARSDQPPLTLLLATVGKVRRWCLR